MKNLFILYLEDSKMDVEIVELYLDEENIEYELTNVYNRSGFISALKKKQFDILLLDYSLPSFDGLSALVIAKKYYPNIPTIIISGNLGEEQAIETLKAGATDYVLKQRMSRFIPSFKRAIKEAKEQRRSKQAEEELRKIEERNRIILEESPLGIYYSNLFGKFIYGNKKAEEIIGFKRSELIGKNFLKLKLLNPKDIIKAAKLLAFNRLGQDTENQEFILNRKDGTKVPVKIDSKIVNLNGKKIVLGIVEDITRRKKSEEALHKSEEKYRIIFENAQIGIYRTSPEGKILVANQALIKMLGYNSLEELQTINLEKDYMFPFKSRKFFIELLERENIVTNLETAWKTKDDKNLFIKENASCIRDEEGKIKYIEGFVEDITESKKSEKEIKKLSTAVEQSANTIVITDTKGDIEYTNPKFTELTGYTAKEVLGQNTRLLNAETQSKKYYAEMWQTITAGKIWRGEFYNKKKNGDYFWESVTITPIKNEFGEITNFLEIKEDITALKENENKLHIQNKELIKAKEKAEESDRLKSAFLANMSHEIRTPMNGILGFTNLLKEPRLKDNEKEQYINIIKKSSDRMLNTIDDIIDISRIEANQVDIVKTEISVNKILNELFDFFNLEAKSKGIELIYKPSLSDNEANIITDKMKLEAILSNFIKNAIKFTINGNVTFGCLLITNNSFKELKFYVKDTGIGIPQSSTKSIFNRFEQADIKNTIIFDGLGLGLSISKSYAEMLGGKIWAESEEGIGSQFYFTIPFYNRNTEISKTINKVAETIPKNMPSTLKTLVVDDEKNVSIFMSIIVEEFSKQILYAETGFNAVKVCKNNPDIDVILMDIKMPIMNGFEATREIRKFNKDVIIIAQTAHAFVSDREKAINAGCNDYISKPINKNELFTLIQKYFKKEI